MTTRHGTLTFDRTLNAAPSSVWAAFAEPEARATWGPPTPEINMAFKHADFRVGGRDLCVCGPGPAEGVTVETYYHAIDPETRIVFTEVIGMPAAPEGASLVTVALAAEGGGTALKITLQVVSLGEEDMLADLEGGWGSSLGNLEDYLAR